jgi:citrate lyase subunit beta/citryl-CoA lyase
MTSTTIAVRRSALYVPGANPRALAKARDLAADVVILDLEDAVLPAAKVEARAAVVAAVRAGGFRAREVVVRVNGADTPWGAGDLAAVAAAGADAVLLPKVGSPADVHAASAGLGAAGAALPLWVMAETPAGILGLDAIAAAGPRLAVVVLGTADLAKALRLPDGARSPALATAAGLAMLAARARGLDILSGIYPDLDDAAGFAAACRADRAAGFDGKTLVHPGQVATANEVFGVSAADAAAAAGLVAGFEAAADRGSGIAVVNGRMVERLHADEARRLLALHAAGQRDKGQGDKGQEHG